MDKAKDFEKGWEQRKADKRKQIEEMIVAVFPWLKEVPVEERNQLKENVSGLMVMERLYDAGYRKIPENAVVLTREEYNTYKADCECWDIKEESYQRQIDELERRIKEDLFTPKEAGEMICKHTKQARKETAEKFRDRVKEYVIDDFSEYDYGYLCMRLDEICKELMEERK